MRTLLPLLIILEICLLGCDDSNHHGNKLSSACSNCLPKIADDTLFYYGITRYSDNTDNFDTVYNDTILIYAISTDSIGYAMKQLKYKELEFLDTANEDITIVPITDAFVANRQGVYQQIFDASEISSKTQLTFINDSLHFRDEISRPTENKNEIRLFRGIAPR